MPPSNLPAGAKKIYLAAEEGAKKSTCKDAGDRQDECAARVAWSAVKRKYKKVGDKWMPKADLQEFSMAIVKASYDKATATRRWRAVASDTDEDTYKDNMTLELFSDFMERIKTEEQPPEGYRSDFWSGGKPYLSVSHYPDLSGKGVPGPVDTVYVDGNRLKSTGRFDDTPIGRACFEAVCADLYSEDGPVPDDEKIRISIAFLDWKHRHKSNGFVFERSENDLICPECLKELITGDYGGKEYLRGHLIHLGMTRVPVNKRTDMEVERSMTTRKEDAASIVGEEIAEELEEETQKMVGKSEALVIKSEEDEIAEELPEEVIEESKHMNEDDDEEEEDKKKKKDEEMKAELVEEADKKEKPKGEYGDVDYADTKNKKYPIDTEAHIRAAWNYINMPRNQKSYSSSEVSAIKGKIVAAWKKKIDKEGPPSAKRAEIEEAHPLDAAFAELRSAYDQATEMEDIQSALQSVQEPFEALGQAIQASLIHEEPELEPTGEVSELAHLLAEFRKEIGEEIGLLRAEINASKSEVPQAVQAPVRRSINPSLIKQPAEQQESKFPKLHKIVSKSVGL